ncbi:MAG: YlmC/YmxH family sporulation protein [Bacilli bacterium]|nr:YlmC/YmxH family sporulation protein [Bacilli bacterium]
MRLSDLQSKRVIDITTGTSIGNITDIIVTVEGKIESLVIEVGKSFLSLTKDNIITIKWENITKIGEDVILVKKE